MCLFQLLERPNDWGLDVFQLAEVVSPSRALGVLGFTLFKVQRSIILSCYSVRRPSSI